MKAVSDDGIVIIVIVIIHNIVVVIIVVLSGIAVRVLACSVAAGALYLVHDVSGSGRAKESSTIRPD